MEQFRNIEGYEGLYQISSEGRVKSLKYGKERILKPASNGHDYLLVILSKDGNRKHHFLHRLVAQTFIENPDNLPQVNHKDECKTNNSVENLEWVTAKDNNNYGTHNIRIAEALSISVDMFTKGGEFIRSFPSAAEGERWLRANGFPKAGNQHIIECCKGKQWHKSYCGFKWYYSKQKELPN